VSDRDLGDLGDPAEVPAAGRARHALSVTRAQGLPDAARVGRAVSPQRLLRQDRMAARPDHELWTNRRAFATLDVSRRADGRGQSPPEGATASG
jgi:hypothetical protein